MSDPLGAIQISHRSGELDPKCIAVKYTLEAVVVEGQFVVLNDDPYGLYYRMTDAVAVR